MARADRSNESQHRFEFCILGVVCKHRLDAARRTRISPFCFDSPGNERVIHFDAQTFKRIGCNEYWARISSIRACDIDYERGYFRLAAIYFKLFSLDRRADPRY